MLQVRCEGNKEGCQRCSEKKLSCVYSVSRVGKVVGRRRKRPLEASLSTLGAEPWVINQPSTFTAIPSPPASQSSEPAFKRHCSLNSWASFLVEEHQDLAEFDAAESVEGLSDMINPSTFCDSMDMSLMYNNGLPTPGMSPPQLRYISPAAFETRPMSRSTSVTTDSARLLPPRFSTSFSAPKTQTPEPVQPEDDETNCIKLLAHLKKHSGQNGQTGQTADVQLDLLRKTNASVRRILRNKGARSNYTCQLLLSSIITHVVYLCEMVASSKAEMSRTSQSPFAPEPGKSETQSDYFARSQQHRSSDHIRPSVVEATNLATEVGDLLKRKPLNGFQVLGRHESHHVELDLRLQRILSKLE